MGVRLAATALLALASLGCSAETQIRYPEKGVTRERAYEATLKAFEDCGLDPRGRRADFVVESRWDWLGVWMNLPVGFPIGRVKERIQERLGKGP